MYQLILFNIFQNSVKYNQFKGDIIITIDCLPMESDDSKYMLETEIIDTGIGISEDRQKMLFIPFLELKLKQNLKQVQDNNIGMGLACSEAISAALQGDITIKQSRRGLSVFAFKIPVTIKSYEEGPGQADVYNEVEEFLKAKKFSNDIVDLISSSRLAFIRNVENFKVVEHDQKLSQ